MAWGPGRYDDLCTAVRDLTGAHSVVLCVIGGHRGSGFSAQQTRRPDTDPGEATVALVAHLRRIADSIEKDSKTEPEPKEDTWTEQK